MAKPEKVATVDDLKGEFSNSSAAVITEYRGLSVAQLQNLRRSLNGEARYAIAKNTLTKIAANQAGVEGIDDQLSGPTAIAFVHGDVVNVAKSLRDFAKENPLLVIKAGLFEGKVLSADEVKKLADLESREVLLAKLAGAMKASMSKAAGTFAAPLSKFARVMAALQEKATADPSVLAGNKADQKQEDASSVETNSEVTETQSETSAEAEEKTTDAASE